MIEAGAEVLRSRTSALRSETCAFIDVEIANAFSSIFQCQTIVHLQLKNGKDNDHHLAVPLLLHHANINYYGRPLRELEDSQNETRHLDKIHVLSDRVANPLHYDPEHHNGCRRKVPRSACPYSKT